MTPKTSTSTSGSTTAMTVEGALTDLSVFMTSARTLRERVEEAVAQSQDCTDEERTRLGDGVASDVRTMARLTQNFLDRLLGSDQWAEVCRAGLAQAAVDDGPVARARDALVELDEAHAQFVDSLHSDIDAAAAAVAAAQEAFELAQAAWLATHAVSSVDSQSTQGDEAAVEPVDWTGTPYDLYAPSTETAEPHNSEPHTAAQEPTASRAGLEADVVALVDIAGAAAALEDLLVGVDVAVADEVRLVHLEELTALDEDFASLDAELRDIQTQQESLERDRQELDGAGRGTRRNRKLRAVVNEEAGRLEQAAMALMDSRAALSAARFAVLESVSEHLADSRAVAVVQEPVTDTSGLVSEGVSAEQDGDGLVDDASEVSEDEHAGVFLDSDSVPEENAKPEESSAGVSADDVAADSAGTDVEALAEHVLAAEDELSRRREALEVELASYTENRVAVLRSVEEAEAAAQAAREALGEAEGAPLTALQTAWLATLASFPALVNAARDAVNEAAAPLM